MFSYKTDNSGLNSLMFWGEFFLSSIVVSTKEPGENTVSKCKIHYRQIKMLSYEKDLKTFKSYIRFAHVECYSAYSMGDMLHGELGC